MCDPERLQEIIEESGLSYRQNTVSWIFDCPRCNKPSKLFIRKRDGRFICWYCASTGSYQGRPEFALADLLQTSVSDVRVRLYGTATALADGLGFAAVLADFFGEGDEVDADIELGAAAAIPTVTWPHNYLPLDHRHAATGVAYLEGRGVPVAVAREYGIRYCPATTSVVFPVMLGDRLVGWQTRQTKPTRWWDEEKGEYVEALKTNTMTGTPKGRVVMFAPRLVGSEHVVLCEGPVDALKAHLCGGNVATMGKGVQLGQREFVRSHGVRRVYLALDPDAASSIRELCEDFADLDVFLMEPPKGYGDIGEMPLAEVKELFDRAPRVSRSKAGRMFVFLG